MRKSIVEEALKARQLHVIKVMPSPENKTIDVFLRV